MIRAGIDRAIVYNIVDKALFPTVDKHASLSTKLKKIKINNNNNSEERLISHEMRQGRLFAKPCCWVRRSDSLGRIRHHIHSTRRAVSMLKLVQCFVDVGFGLLSIMKTLVDTSPSSDVRMHTDRNLNVIVWITILAETIVCDHWYIMRWCISNLICRNRNLFQFTQPYIIVEIPQLAKSCVKSPLP